MDDALKELLPKSDEDKFLRVAHKDRWTHLKPVIVKLYTGTYSVPGATATLHQVVQFMKTHYSFHAAPTEYPPRFRAWGVAKRTVNSVKEDIMSALGRRKRPGTSTSQVIVHQGSQDLPFDAKKFRRHLKGKKTFVEAITPGLLSSWNLPYNALISSMPKNPDHPSPFGDTRRTPAYLSIQSPEALTPGREVAGPSPNMKLVYEKTKQDNTNLFLQGRIEELLVRMVKEDRITFVDYFHDFYMHGFVTAKQWPLKPLILDFPSDTSSLERSSRMNIFAPPTLLCQWSVHVPDVSDQIETAPSHEAADPVTSRGSFVESLHQSIITNSFTNTLADDLPLAQEMVVRSLESDPKTLQLDAWKLAIMAANTQLLEDLFSKNSCRLPENIDAIHAFHLAAAFLHGGDKCCEVIITLSNFFDPAYAFYHNVDNFGHTILDAFMVSILRSHTSLIPEFVSHGFHSSGRFPGEEKDICGRWDADNPLVRQLFKDGFHRIPNKWKHPFCHTAVQAICHNIIAIFGSPVSPKINALSGLFLRCCTECGMELKLGPLHVLIITAFYLAQSGMQGETLFGALAVMTCLLALGADDSLKVHVSVEEILGSPESGECRHSPLSALELMRVIPDNAIKGWTQGCQTGWTCILQTLAQAEREKDWRQINNADASQGNDAIGVSGLSADSLDDSAEHVCIFGRDFHDDGLKLPCRGPGMGLLWATIQGELLIYRKVSERDAWISENFSMKVLQTWLEGKSPDFLTPLVINKMLKGHSRCGWFLTDGTDPALSAVARGVQTAIAVCKSFQKNCGPSRLASPSRLRNPPVAMRACPKHYQLASIDGHLESSCHEGPLNTRTAAVSDIRSPSSLTLKRAAEQSGANKRLHKRSRSSDSETENSVMTEHQENKPFACPFYRMDPVRHVDCISRKLHRIHDVKQHLHRRHSLEFSCTKCWEWFSSSRQREKHLRSGPCESRHAPNNIEYMSSKAQDLLTRRVDRTLEGNEQWYMIWGMLFEDEDKTRNPYLGSLVEEAIGITRNYLKEEGNLVMSKLPQMDQQLMGGDRNYEQLFLQLLDAARDNVEQKHRESNSTRIIETSTGDNPINSVTETRQKLKYDHQCHIRQPESAPPSPPVLSRSSTYVSELATTPQLCSAPDIPTVYGFQNGKFQMPLDEVMRELGSTTSSGRMHYFNQSYLISLAMPNGPTVSSNTICIQAMRQ
ncbi:hypothetical protein EDB81DRAFT_701814 [Dactylonectria macrodidyma]|uniref:Clr5 domain-containing protein n=1 Tax=Dactylonectria macrodidyma TaxID=307937 RepID=A0A9P9IF01_9HYPO|nr:hypothetical protein EDB81DRAFT_701814 [Dactylonectria macrodidyma]